MRFTNAAVVAGFVAASQAIVLPPISSTDFEPFAAPVGGAEEVGGITLNLPCKSCPFQTGSDAYGPTWAEGIESELRLDFFIEQGDTGILTLNGVQIYPTPIIPSATIAALQTASDGREPAYVVLGYELLSKPVASSKQDELDLVAIRLQIFEIGDRFVDGLESVEVRILKTPSGRLVAVKLDRAPTTNAGGKDCASFICKVKSMMATKLDAIKSIKLGTGCPKAAAKHAGKGSHKGNHGNRPHHKQRGFRKFLHAMKSIALHVLIPVFIGIAVGLAASMIGMVVGHAVVLIWRTFHGRRRRGTCGRIMLRESVDDAREDAKPFLDHQEPSPAYEDSLIDEKKAIL